MVESDSSSAIDVERALHMDIALSTRLMKYANSAVYGFRGQIGTLRRAITLIGLRAVKSLVLSTAMLNAFPRGDSRTEYLWRHGVSVGALARLIALRRRGVHPETAFVAGLIHDVGKFVLLQLYPRRYGLVFEEANLSGGEFQALEEESFGADHAAVGARVVSDWGFGDRLVAAVQLHHATGCLFDGSMPEPMRALIAVVSLADELAYAGQRSTDPVEPPALTPSAAQELIALRDDEMAALWTEHYSVVREADLLLS